MNRLALKALIPITLCILGLLAGAGQARAMPSFIGGGGRAVILSPLENMFPTYNLDGYVSVIESAGYSVDVLINSDVSIDFLRTGLSGYDLIIMRTQYFTLESVSFYCSGEPVNPTNAWETNSTYHTEIAARELSLSVACVGFSSLFIQHNYGSGSLSPGLVFLTESYGADLSSVFLESGTATFLGYIQAYHPGWGNNDAMAIKYLSYLAQGYSVANAESLFYAYLRQGHGVTADWPQLLWYGDGDYTI